MYGEVPSAYGDAAPHIVQKSMIVFRDMDGNEVSRVWRGLEDRYGDVFNTDQTTVNESVAVCEKGEKGKGGFKVGETMEETMNELNEIIRTSRMMENAQNIM